ELRMVMFAAALAERGHHVTLAARFNDRFNSFLRERRLSLDKVVVIPPPGNRLKETLSWYRKLVREKYDVWVVPKGGIGSGSLSLEVVNRMFFRNLITTEHNIAVAMPPTRLLFGSIPIWGFWRCWAF